MALSVAFDRRIDTPRGLLVTTILAGLAFALPLPWGHHLLVSFSAVWVFAALAAISTTLLALVFAVTIFRGQYLGGRLPPEVAGALLRPRWHGASCIRLGLVALSALALLVTTTETRTPKASLTVLLYAVVVLVITVIRINRGIGHVFSSRFPDMVANAVVRLGAEGDPLIVERTALSCLRDGDVSTAHIILERHVTHVSDELTRYPENSRDILGPSVRMLSTVARNAIASDERTVHYCFDGLESLLVRSLEQHEPWHYRVELVEALRQIRRAASRVGNEVIAADGLYALVRSYPKALQIAPSEDKVWLLQDDLNASAADANPDLDNEWEQLAYGWSGEVAGDLNIAIERNQAELFKTGQFALRSFAYDVLETKTLGPKQRRVLLKWILFEAQSSISKAMLAGRGEAFCCWEFEGTFARALAAQQLNDVESQFIESMGTVVISAARAGKLPWIALNQLSALGRGFVSKQEDQLACMVIEILETLAAPLSGDGNEELIERYLEAAAGLRSIGEWDKRKESATKTAVEKALARYEKEQERLVAWKKAFPSRRHVDGKKHHSGPWA